MSTPISMRPNPHNTRASALIITMFLVSLLAIMLVGFAASMRSEIFSARSHLGGVQAGLLAQAATDTALNQLTTQLGSTTASGFFWSTMPGALATKAAGGSITWTDLSSGVMAVGSSADLAADLNIKSLVNSGQNLIATVTNSTALPMRAKWIYVRQDGTTFTTSTVPTYTTSNPIVGRFAYWVDDESAKININTAALRAGNTKSLEHPSRIDLSALSPSLTATDATAIANFRNTYHYFDAPTDLAQATGTMSTAMKTISHALTHFNHSPNVNMFNEPRILLTTKKSVADAAGTTNFLDILSTQSADPGVMVLPNGALNLDTLKVNALVMRLYQYFTKTDWPFLTGKSFATKFSPARPERTIQIILNIIDYVRSAETTLPLVEPLRGQWNGATSTFTMSTVSVNANSYLGSSRRFCIVEVGAYIPATPSRIAGTDIVYTASYKLKVYYPPQVGGSTATAVNLTTLYAGVSNDIGADSAAPYTIGYDLPIKTTPVTLSTAQYISGSNPSSSIIYPGQYAVIAVNTELHYCNTRPAIISAIPFISNPPWAASTVGYRLDRVPMSGVLNYTVDAPAVLPANITSLKAKDPFANKLNVDWTQGPNAFGAPPAFSSAITTGLAAQQDLNSTATALSTVSVRVPAPKNVSPNMLGQVLSVGELGYIHTGVECSTYSGAVGIPFRTLRLQPMASTSTVLPDWAMLDLFAAPPVTASISSTDVPYILPSKTTVSGIILPNYGGQINPNNRLISFTNSLGADQIPRPQPLLALVANVTNSITGTTSVSATQATTLSSNIAYRVLSTASATVTGANYASGTMGTNIYFAPGQIVEMRGVADGGEDSEELVRNLLPLMTVRANVFTIYSVGQTIKQIPSGTIQVTGERRYQTMVERTITGNKVKFQTDYARDLRP